MPEEVAAWLTSDPGIRDRILDYLTKHGSGTTFTEFFWKGCEPHPYEVERYPRYVDTLLLQVGGRTVADTARFTGVNQQSVRAWTRFEQKPKLAHYLALYLQLGNPAKGWVWLSINNTSGHAVPLGPLIQVPKAISSWDDVAAVLAQLEPLEPMPTGVSREYLFGFLVGMIIGDAAKSRSRNWHRHIGLVLSKKYETNENIGDFTSACARNFGLRMHRVGDQRKPEHKPFGFYEWVSQASPLVDWMFNVVLGLRDGERTTYDAVRMNWVFEAPTDFRRGLVQGIAESDGSVAIASQTVEFWIGPNWDFMKRLLATFGVRSFRSREALSVSRRQILNLGTIPPFSPVLETVRYSRFEKLVRANHIGRGKRLPGEIRRFIALHAAESSVPDISEKVLDTFGVVLGYEAVERWVRKAEIQPSGAVIA